LWCGVFTPEICPSILDTPYINTNQYGTVLDVADWKKSEIFGENTVPKSTFVPQIPNGLA
jgi:hypothetical protein